MDKEVLFTIKRRLERLGDKNIAEAQTKESFINPLISALDWDVADFDEVKFEYKHTKKATPVDYALLIDMTPKLYIEAKPLGSNLDDYKRTAQILTYATMAGVKWALLTDGNHYKLYNTTAEARLEEKLFYEFKIKDLKEENIGKVLSLLCLLSREKLKDDEIDLAWKNHFEVNKVRKSLEKMIDEKDEALLKLINRKTKLGKAIIANSLNKLRIKIEKLTTFDIADSPKPPPEPSKGYAGTKPTKAVLFNEAFEIGSWRELLITTSEKLILRNPDRFNSLADSEVMRGTKMTYLTRNKNILRNPLPLSNGLFVEGNLSANTIVKVINKILKSCGYKETDIKIFY